MSERVDIEVRVSPVHGRGVFALRDFAAGEAVIRQEGVVLQAAALADEVKALQIGPDLWLLADDQNPHPSDDVNHACAPNLGYVDGSLTLTALRPIAAGEELTFDYSTALDDRTWAIPCRCGVPTCRGVIRGWSELPAALRASLRPLALAWLRGA